MTGTEAYAMRERLCDAAPQITTGTTKQNEWAWTLRANAVLYACMIMGDEHPSRVEQFANIADAQFWIDTRHLHDRPDTAIVNAVARGLMVSE